jgi:hypothetical protein
MRLALLAVLVFLTGCASSTSQYYDAVQKTAEANARAVQAKFEALSKIASSGDGQAASAAVMALALTSTPNAQPLPQQSEAIQWASVLASPVTSLGMMWMQSDSAKTMARYNSKVDIARVTADAQTEQALYGSFADISSAGFTAMGNVDYTPFVNGMVDLGTAGINGAVTLGTAGFESNVTLGTAGFDALVETNASNNSLYSSVWSDYTASIQNIMANVPNVICSVTSDGAGGTTVTCD